MSHYASMVFLVVWALVLLGVDYLFWVGYLDGLTISQAVRWLALRSPTLIRFLYLALCSLGYLHFFSN